MSCKLIWITPDAERIITYCARVSSKDQDNPNIKGLLKYCIREGHYSIFEQANMCIQIETTRAISAQILRHRSFSFQEFSQRYSKVEKKPDYFDLRRQDNKNRQNSIDDISEETKKNLNNSIRMTLIEVDRCYQNLLDNGVAKECARMILPMCSHTKLYMNGTIRSWLTYLDLRCGHGTQKEHIIIANKIKEIFKKELPIIYDAYFILR
jgi:thymidylate synthase (FAD)